MKERVSYDNYYDRDRADTYEKRRGVGLFGVCVIAVGAGLAGYVIGYKHARSVAKSLIDTVLEKFPDHKKAFKAVWNDSVEGYFEEK